MPVIDARTLDDGHRITRLRMLGGTSNHWGGNVRPLDAIDFDPKPDPAADAESGADDRDMGGWPFGLADLQPHHDRARDLLGLPRNAFDVARFSDANGLRPWGHGRRPARWSARRSARATMVNVGFPDDGARSPAPVAATSRPAGSPPSTAGCWR